MHCNQIYCYRNTRKKSCSVGTIEEEKARESCGCSAATGRAKWIILHTHTGRVRHGLVGVGGKRLSIFGVTGKTPPLHPHLWLPFQFFLLFFFFFFIIEILPSSRLHFELPTHAEDCCKMSSVSANVGQFLWAAAKCQDAWHVRQLPQLQQRRNSLLATQQQHHHQRLELKKQQWLVTCS